MAYDKAVDSTALETGLTTIADAIRAKGGTSAPLEFPQGMADAVAAISGGGGTAQQELDGVATKSVAVLHLMADHVESEVFRYQANLVEIYGDKITEVGASSFRDCPKLSIVHMPKAKCFLTACFMSATNLKVIRLESASRLDRVAFAYTGLEKFILPGSRIAELNNTACFQNTPIADGTGYIYVPKALVEQYKVATNWIAYAAQIRAIEDYPEITGG